MITSVDDILVWSSGFWLYRSEHYEYNGSYLSDEFKVLYRNTPEWNAFVTVCATYS